MGFVQFVKLVAKKVSQIATPPLLFFDRNEQRFEIAFAEALAALSRKSVV